jgi:hypothetical protein
VGSLTRSSRRPSANPAGDDVWRAWLEPHEAAFVLEKPLCEVLRMLRTDALRDVRCACRRGIDTEQLTQLVAGRWLAMQALEAIATGRLRVRRPDDDALAVTLMESWDRLW